MEEEKTIIETPVEVPPDNFIGNELTEQQIAAGEVFTRLVDARGGIDKLSEEDKQEIRDTGGVI